MEFIAKYIHSGHERIQQKRAQVRHEYNYDDQIDEFQKNTSRLRDAPSGKQRKWHLYDSNTFWTERYYVPPANITDLETTDRFIESASVMPYLEVSLDTKKCDRILIVGCGDSGLGPYLHSRGHQNVTCMDLCAKVIRRRRISHKALHGLEWVCADAREMLATPRGWYDFIIDIGTMDTLLTGVSGLHDAHAMMAEVNRVVRPGGVFFMFSVGSAKSRMHFLKHKSLHWTVRHGKTVGGLFWFQAKQPRSEADYVFY